MKNINAWIKDLFRELQNNITQPALNTIRCLLVVSMIALIVFQTMSVVSGLLYISSISSHSPYSDSPLQLRLYKGYNVDYSNPWNRVLLNSKGKPVFFANAFFYKDNLSPKDSLFVYSKGGYRGYFNLNTGNDEIPSSDKRFLRAWFFDNESGLAAVQDAQSKKIGFINPQGDYVIPPQYQNLMWKDYMFEQNECVVYDASGQCSLIDTNGRIILTGYDDISEVMHGHRILTKINKVGLWKDSVVLPVEYDAIDLFHSKIELTKDGRCWSIGYDYKTVIDLDIFDYVYSLSCESSSDFTTSNDESPQYCNSPKLKDLIICRLNRLDGLYNVKQQKLVVPIEWDEIKIVKTGGNECVLYGKKNDKWTLLKW